MYFDGRRRRGDISRVKKTRRGLGRFGRWAVTFLIILVLFMLLIPMNQETDGIFGKCTPWIVAFLLILVVLSLLIPIKGSRTGVFGKYTPFVAAFLIIYVLLMMFVGRFPRGICPVF